MLSFHKKKRECLEERPASIVLDRGRAGGPDIREIRLSFSWEEESERIFYKRGALGSSAGGRRGPLPGGKVVRWGALGREVPRKKKGGIRGPPRTRGGGSLRENSRGESKNGRSTSNGGERDGDGRMASLPIACERADGIGCHTMHVTRPCVEAGQAKAAEDGSRSVRMVAVPPVSSRSKEDDPMQITQDGGMCCRRAHSCAS